MSHQLPKSYEAFLEWQRREDNPIRVLRDNDHPLPITFQAGWDAAIASVKREPLSMKLAPKDCNILLFFRRWGWVRGSWNADKYAKHPKPYWSCDQERIWGIRDVRLNQPIHWMPLPPSPVTATTASREDEN